MPRTLELMIDNELYQSLADELQAAHRQREAADPDAPAWEADAHASRIEQLIRALVLEGLEPKEAD
jgi:hypothetical protein